MRKRRGDDSGVQVLDTPVEILRRRARRLAREGDYRKAAVALRELTALADDAASYVKLGDMLRRARREGEALQALREGLWRHRQAGNDLRARSVARLFLVMEPADTKAQRFAA